MLKLSLSRCATGKPWVAQIMGADQKFGFLRLFVEPVAKLDREWRYELPPGVYELKDIYKRDGKGRRFLYIDTDSGVEEINMNEVLGRLAGSKAPAPRPTVPASIPTGVAVRPDEYDEVLLLARARQNVLLVGPAGCGKTYLAEQVAKELGLPFSFLSLAGGVSESALLGRLLPTGEAGRFEYSRSEFIKCYEEGGVFLLDEVDAADANVMLALNMALANGHMAVPARVGNPVAKRHDSFVCLAAANTWGNGGDRTYVGRNQLDGAFMDRFRAGQIPMDYSDVVEKTLVNPEVLAWGRAVRTQIRKLGLRRVMSTRVLRDITTQIGAGRKFAACKKSYFADWKLDEVGQVDAEYAATMKR